MSPSLALVFWLILLVALLYFDPAKDSRTSLALWVPVIWIFILGSRLPSQWFGSQTGMATQALVDGNPIDRTISSMLILLAIGTLILRSFKWSDCVTRNFALMALLSFALMSVLWSDLPLVSLKRWIRDLGNYLVILVILSDSHPLDAVRTVLRRASYLLIPLSIVLIKYFPALGKQFSIWTGAAQFVGVATSKNMLGAACLVSGVFFFWDTVTRWSNRQERRTKRILVVNCAFIAMTLWLLNLSNSATSRVCLVIGCLVVVAAQSGWGKRHPGFLKTVIPACFCLYLILAFGFNLSGTMASQVGRDPTLTERTSIWNIVLNMHTNPLVGTGYDSFWLGPRLEKIWQTMPGINEAHNGYLEVYLNQGSIGFFLLAGLLIASYRTICKQLSLSPRLASLNLALWTIMLFYNMTEAAFRAHLMWVVFLLAAIAVPQHAADRVPEAIAFDNAGGAGRFLGPPLEATHRRR